MEYAELRMVISIANAATTSVHPLSASVTDLKRYESAW